jgi:hypothetical protein
MAWRAMEHLAIFDVYVEIVAGQKIRPAAGDNRSGPNSERSLI